MSDSQFKRSLPTSTYRFQLTSGHGKPGEDGYNAPLTFADVAKQIPYLKKLGISHVYLSPIMEANPGSAGYGALDYNAISTELGGEAGYKQMARALHEAGIGVIVDIVPNHMAATPENGWFRDVLQNGRNANAAKIFDIRWDEANGKINLPTLGASRKDLVLKSNPNDRELKLVINPKTHEIELGYWENRFPLSQSSLRKHQKSTESQEAFVERINHCRDGKDLLNLLDDQHYNLDQWQDGYSSLNYRRFFNINGLIGIRQEDPEVFAQTHQTLGRLMQEGLIDGVRIDHIDGLSKPTEYLRSLDRLIKAKVGVEDRPNFYVAAEKILAPDEHTPPQWRDEKLLNGTTGYDYLVAAGKLLTSNKKAELEKVYADYLGTEKAPDVQEIVHASRMRVMNDELIPEFRRIRDQLLTLAQQIEPQSQNYDLTHAFKELMCAYPVYRFYPENGQYTEQEQRIIHTMFENVVAQHPELAKEFALLKRIYTFDVPGAYRQNTQDFVDALQQFSSPMVAKGTEDTAFYRYHLLRAANEVGGELGHISMTPDEFMTFIATRDATAMNVSSTHDTKLGENARLRGLALSYIPAQWGELAAEWKKHYQSTHSAENQIHPQDQYLLLQTIAATYPLALLFDDVSKNEGLSPEAIREDYIKRIQGFAIKAVREGKERSDHVPPSQDMEYESKVKDFINSIVRDEAFLKTPLPSGQSPQEFITRLACVSANVSLENILCKVGSPGIPDIYQGSEEWLHTTVDPDNRMTPDFDRLHKSLNEAQGEDIDKLSQSWPDGRIKQVIMAIMLNMSREHPDVFRDSPPVPLKVYSGNKEDTSALAFARISQSHPDQAVILFVPRLMENDLYKTDSLGVKRELTDQEITIEIPESLKNRHFIDALRGNDAEVEGNRIKFTDKMRRIPGAVWTTRTEDSQESSQGVQR